MVLEKCWLNKQTNKLRHEKSASLCPEQKSILPPVSFKVTSHTGAWQQPGDLDLSDLILSAFLPRVFTQHLPPQCPGQTGLLFLQRRRQTERTSPPSQIYFGFFLSLAEERIDQILPWGNTHRKNSSGEQLHHIKYHDSFPSSSEFGSRLGPYLESPNCKSTLEKLSGNWRPRF